MTTPFARWHPVPVAALTILALLAGCLGTSAPSQTSGLPAEPGVSFGSYEEAKTADGPTFEPAGLGGVASDTIEGCGHGIDGVDYRASHTFPVGSEHAENISLLIELDPITPAHRYEFTLRDADGARVDSVTMDVTNPEAEMNSTGDDLPVGDWTVDVHGRGVDVIYEIHWHVEYASSHPLTLKLLEPIEPIEPGPSAFTFLLYDERDDAPVTDADAEIASRLPERGNGSDGDEADPVHTGHGVHVGKIHPDAPGAWIVEVDVPFDGVDVRFEPPVTVEDPDADERSGGDARTPSGPPTASEGCSGRS